MKRIIDSLVEAASLMNEAAAKLQKVNDILNGPAQDETDSLTKTERKIFDLIAQGMTLDKITDHLKISMKTLDTHRQNIKNKLNLDSVNDLAKQAQRPAG